MYEKYRQISTRTKSQNLNVSRLVLQLSLPNSLEPGVKSRMKNEDVAPVGAAPTTSEWSKILLPTYIRGLSVIEL